MPTEPDPAQDAQETRDTRDAQQPVDPSEPGADPATENWQPTGLELARAVARSVAAGSASAPNRTGKSQPRKRFRRRSDPGLASGSGPDDRDPQLLDATVERLVAEQGWSTDVAVAGALARWDQIVGPDVAAHCKAERFADAELTVRADSTAWATQVRMLAPTLVKRLNEELGDGTVRRVNVVGPSSPTWRKGPRSVRDGRGPRDTYG